MKVIGQLEGAQIENMVGLPANPSRGRIILDVTVPTAGNPRLWTGTQWISLANGNFVSPLTTKGDLLSFDGSNNVRVGVGANGFVPTADSTQVVGWRWAAAPGGTLAPLSIVSKIANYTLTNADDIVELNSAGGPFTISLQAANTATKKVYRLKMLSTATQPVLVLPNGADKIDGLNSVSLVGATQSIVIAPNAATNGWSVF